MLLISILLVVLYTSTAIGIKRELPVSISSMVYTISSNIWRYIWQIWLALSTICLTPKLFECTENSSFQFIAFLTVACLIFVSALPLIEKDKNTIHNVLGITGGILSQICVLIICPWWLILWPIILFAYYKLHNKDFYKKYIEGKEVFVSEVICYLTLVGSLILH